MSTTILVHLSSMVTGKIELGATKTRKRWKNKRLLTKMEILKTTNLEVVIPELRYLLRRQSIVKRKMMKVKLPNLNKVSRSRMKVSNK